ncbi:MAG: serine/threonine-protein kinase PknK, partial [Anaerolineales bacterium]|nr:serine/threonine-protein kinase PknK [Anaerolineales bacterium]
MEELIGQTLGKYKLYSRLGMGGMARVYKAYQENLDRYVALKVMHSYLTEEDEFVARFKREASAVARLRHPNIVQVHDFDINEDQIHYMVMEFIDGPSLKDELEMRSLQANPFALTDVAKIISGLANAVDYAHERGIVHRDIKPANIMFTADGHVVLTDFGIVRMVGATYQTSTGFLAGTPAYMSPEQGRGEHGDHRSDIYSLGIILFELLTGRLPFDADTPFGLIKQHLDVSPPSPSEYNPDIPLAAEMVLNKALAKQPDARYQKAREMAAELQQAAQTSPDVLLQPPPVTTIAPPKESEKTTALDTPILPEADTAVHSSPYRGLRAFSEEDAPFFFGREAFTEQLIEAVETQPLIAVIGPSGSGKSSVVHAGLLPKLRQDSHWIIATMRPGSDPVQSLAAACVAQLKPDLSETSQLTRTSELAHTMRTGRVHFHEVVNDILAKRPTNGSSQRRLLLVVDQFEEIYTLCADRRLRRQFLDELLNSVDIQQFDENTTFTLVFTLRTDFLSQALNYRPLADALQNMDIKLGPMTRRELGRAIASPARRHGFAFETGLVARILEDVGDEPGNLPLLEFALTTLWDSREDRKLTNEAYEAIGQVEGALAR